MTKPKRKGVFVGAYIPQYMKDELAKRAKATRDGSMSKVLSDILRREIGTYGEETPEKRYSRRYDRSWQPPTQADETPEEKYNRKAQTAIERLDKKDTE